MMVVPPPRAMMPWSSSLPATERVVKSIATPSDVTNSKPAANCQVLFLTRCITCSFGATRSRQPPLKAAPRGAIAFATEIVFVLLPKDVEACAICIHARDSVRAVPVRHEAFRRDDTLDDPRARSGAMAADAEDSVASIRVLDCKDGVPVGGVRANEVGQDEELKDIEFPAREAGNPVRAASRDRARVRAAIVCHPGAAARDGAGHSSARRRRNKGS